MQITTFLKNIILTITFIFLSVSVIYSSGSTVHTEHLQVSSQQYWLLLYRKTNKEYLYHGIPGNRIQSQLVREFTVKSGRPSERPTPLPKLLGRKYWTIVDTVETPDSPETAPYFLTLDIPYTEYPPYGPAPYRECNGQCNWQLPGAFGLHGISNDSSRLSIDNPGSSGCIRHSTDDITYLYKLVRIVSYPVRYYMEDI